MLRKTSGLVLGLVFLGLIGVPTGTEAQETTITTTRDSDIDENQPDHNNGSDVTLQVNPGNTRKRVVVYVDFSTLQGQTVEEATLRMYLHSSFQPRTYAVHRIEYDPDERDWTEGEVTWNRYESDEDWHSAGGDYRAQFTDTASNDGAGPQWIEWDVTSDVRWFLNQQGFCAVGENFGWVVKDYNENSGSFGGHFRSREHEGGVLAPEVVVEYTPSGTRVSGLTADVVAGGVRLRWTTESESDVAGFNVLRSRAGGEYLAVNAAPIPAQGSAVGLHYSYVDNSGTRSDLYILEAILVSGGSERVGPVQPSASGVSEAGRPVDVVLHLSPNPARGPVRIAFSDVSPTVTVYDATGREVCRLTADRSSDGHVAVWNGTDGSGRAVQRGVYFCKTATQRAKLVVF